MSAIEIIASSIQTAFLSIFQISPLLIVPVVFGIFFLFYKFLGYAIRLFSIGLLFALIPFVELFSGITLLPFEMSFLGKLAFSVGAGVAIFSIYEFIRFVNKLFPKSQKPITRTVYIEEKVKHKKK